MIEIDNALSRKFQQLKIIITTFKSKRNKIKERQV